MYRDGIRTLRDKSWNTLTMNIKISEWKEPEKYLFKYILLKEVFYIDSIFS